MAVCLRVISDGDEDKKVLDYLRAEEPYGSLELSSAVYGSLKLSIKGLNTIPKEVYEYTNLTKLDLTHNNLTSFPPICDVLLNLEEVLLDDNMLTNLPSDMSSLSKLSTLSLNYNRFKHIPSILASIPSLRNLNFNWNWIEGFKEDSPLFQLKNLKTLSLSSNKITVLPPGFCQLTCLSTVNLRRNSIRSLPKELEQLQNLSEFYVAENPINAILVDFSNFPKLLTLSMWSCLFSSFPPSSSSHAEKIFSVTRLDISDCKLEFIGGGWPACAHLDVSDNQLTTLEDIQNPSHLTHLLASNNKIDSLPSWMLSPSPVSPTSSPLISLPPLSLAPLVKIDLSNNALKEIPKGLGGLLKLRNLDLSRNSIKNCDGLEELLCLPDLRILQLASNQISSLPAHPNPLPPGKLYKASPKTQAPNLHFLNFHDNFLQDIPSSFFQFFPLFANKHARSPGTRTVILSYNQFLNIPEELGNIEGLECLHFAGNDVNSDSLEQFLPKWPLLRVLSLADVRINDTCSPSPTTPPTPFATPPPSPLFDKREKKSPPFSSPSASPLLPPSSPRLSVPEGIHNCCSNLHRLHLRNTPLSSLPNSLFQMSRSLYEVDLSPISALSLPDTEDPRLALPLSIPPANEDYSVENCEKLSASLPSPSPSFPSFASPTSSPLFGTIGEGLGGNMSVPSRKHRTRATGGRRVRVSSSTQPTFASSGLSSTTPTFLSPPPSPMIRSTPLSSPFSSPTVTPLSSPGLFAEGVGGVPLSGEQTIRRWKGGDVGCAKIIGVEGKNEDRLLVRFGNGVQVDRDNKKEGNGEQEKEKREEGEFDWGYFGVFDGHGGKEGSTFVCNQFHKILLAELGEISKNPDDWTEEVIVSSMQKSFTIVTEKMHKHFLSHHIKTMQGTTATVGFVLKDILYIANVGDSRATLCWGGEAIRISRDHKPGDQDEMERVRKMRGLMKPFTKNSKRYRIFQVAARSGGRSVALSRTLGDFHVHPFVSGHPHIVSLSLPFFSSPQPSLVFPPPETPPPNPLPPKSSSFFSSFNWGLGLGYSAELPSGSSPSPPKPISFSPSETSEDCFLVMASDGLWDVCTDSDVAQIIRFSEDATQGAIRLRDHAVHLGSMDDTAVLVVRFEGLKVKHVNGLSKSSSEELE